MSEPTIIHPQFHKCRDYVLDPFWKEIFLACACNKFPRGVYYDSSANTLNIRTPDSGGRTKVDVVDLSEKPEEIYCVVMQLFREKLGKFSCRDLQIRSEELDEIQQKQKITRDCEWKKLKPKSTKDFLILDYISTLKEKHNLSRKEAKNLLSTIHLGFRLRKLDSNDVVYQKGEIQNIKGLEYDSKRKRWLVDRPIGIVYKTEKVAVSQKFTQSLKRYTKEHRSRRLQL